MLLAVNENVCSFHDTERCAIIYLGDINREFVLWIIWKNQVEICCHLVNDYKKMLWQFYTGPTHGSIHFNCSSQILYEAKSLIKKSYETIKRLYEAITHLLSIDSITPWCSLHIDSYSSINIDYAIQSMIVNLYASGFHTVCDLCNTPNMTNHLAYPAITTHA